MVHSVYVPHLRDNHTPKKTKTLQKYEIVDFSFTYKYVQFCSEFEHGGSSFGNAVKKSAEFIAVAAKQ